MSLKINQRLETGNKYSIEVVLVIENSFRQ